MTTHTTADFVSAHETLYATYTDWCEGFTADDLATQSLCPDWDVRGVLGHAIGVEAVLDGWEPSTELPPPFGKMGEFAASIADLDPAGVAAEVAEVTSSRLAHLRSLDADAAEAPSITPTGVKTYGDFLRIRVFDLWVHAHDIAIPLGRTVDAATVATEMALDEVGGAIGYIMGKKVGLPDGMSAVVHVTGEVERDIAVVVDGKARAVDSVEDPDAELTADLETFILLAAGRIDPEARIDGGRITWSGDARWGERMARNLAYTM
ncbi:MAG: maleylpyruvate isomerase family mycothiol-dependent enzyme [Acidimicrobiales bacterium]|nr:maleylpyruvate isomerase family mycothiol-dependent enzyme [Acidimicrobiales bacterium]